MEGKYLNFAHACCTNLGHNLLHILLQFSHTEQTYGVSYLPGYGRDSYSSYRIADSTIGDGEDLVSASHKRDAEVLRSVERQMVSRFRTVHVNK